MTGTWLLVRRDSKTGGAAVRADFDFTRLALGDGEFLRLLAGLLDADTVGGVLVVRRGRLEHRLTCECGRWRDNSKPMGEGWQGSNRLLHAYGSVAGSGVPAGMKEGAPQSASKRKPTPR